ncbi:class I SAM-dependent methyltransferase [Streptomyces sp. SL13]|uniref:Class I SAM-dependent methyltransferase n=1 Tax=Streptantibioticus silvisoli TaxID=2705255 RepID=A0AA90KAX1_9ACTN|nr:class I SAM-dependent methyltransferase [Streptantibioticus silvisoli]MDI5965576.1 class I SAM-dependent methyltransferase [Streptantibioticus silvisoli]MDI5972597.1 class I SAM-dependent methyltransferase [Streptantibioticus silvisoli]
MDPATLGAYDRDAAAFADDWHGQPAPADLQAAVRRFFRPGPTADIGCGAGRDTAWLHANGYDPTGYDASAGLLAEARRRHPGVRFAPAALPALDGLPTAAFANVLCETVIMHLPQPDLAPALLRVMSLLVPGGTLYLTWRVTEGADRRDEHGRLYAAVDERAVRQALTPGVPLLDEEVVSASSGRTVRRVVVRKDG